MTCHDDHETIALKIGPYVDGELPYEEIESVEAHLRDCAECHTRALTFRDLDRHAAAVKVPQVEPARWSRMLEAIQAEATAAEVIRPTGAFGRRWFAAMAAAAAVLLFGLFVATNWHPSGSDPDAGPSISQPAEGPTESDASSPRERIAHRGGEGDEIEAPPDPKEDDDGLPGPADGTEGSPPLDASDI